MNVLKPIVDTLDGIPEALKGEYRPGTADEKLEGKFVLTVEPTAGWALENTEGLKSALGAARTDLNSANGRLKAFGDLDPVKAKDAVAKIAELGTLDPKKDVDRLVEEKVQATLGQVNERHNEEKSALEKKLGLRDNLLKDTFQREAAVKAIASAKGDVDLLLPHVLPSVSFDLEETDSGLTPKVKIVDANGNVRIGDGSGSNMTLDQRVAEMKTDSKFARLFDGSGHQGSGDDNNQNRGGGGGGGGQQGGKKLSELSRRDKSKLIGEIGLQAYEARVQAERE
jgi:hypothetical protein